MAELADQVARLADRLRSLSDVRLAAALPGGGAGPTRPTPLAQQLADAAAELAGEPRRAVPRLDDLVVGDQVAVTGTDLVDALAGQRQGADDAGRRARLLRMTAEWAIAAVRGLRDLV